MHLNKYVSSDLIWRSTCHPILQRPVLPIPPAINDPSSTRYSHLWIKPIPNKKSVLCTLASNTTTMGD
ncbi:hypothetical protein DPMN_015186 [Dreissena polymorpha]|uniref:Uncharacterized protein n=1 Tax=Dreissena polymorpha TaxID=45954 RepID=A0A9D4N7B6_DREPO|nr:hypothetical protein DPMN_015186 [Dreissena polymorpha]